MWKGKGAGNPEEVLMRVVLVNGSPRKEMCTYTALQEVASALEKNGVETEIIQASFDSEEIEKAAAEILESDGLVVGSPVYYASPTGLVLYFLDEVFNRISGKVRMKVGASVVTCRRGGAASSFDVLNKYFTISQMLVVSSNYWNMVHGNTPEEVRKDEEGMQTLRLLGENMAYVIKALDKAALPLPEMEKRVRTNFIR